MSRYAERTEVSSEKCREPLDVAIVHPGEEWALAYLAIELAPVGGYHVWPDRPWNYRESQKPYWRPDLDAALVAARDICTAWAAEIAEDPDQPSAGYLLEVSSPRLDEILHLESIPDARTGPASPRAGARIAPREAGHD